MFNEALYNQRLTRMDDALHGKTPDKVPVLSIVDNWAVFYSGYTLGEVVNDKEKLIQAYAKTLRDFPWDAAYFNVLTRNVKYCNALGGGGYTGDIKAIQVDTSEIGGMEEDEYPELIKDPLRFIADTVAPRKYKLFQNSNEEEKYADYCNAVNEIWEFKKVAAEANDYAKNELNLPMVRPAGFFHPCDILLDYLRNFAGTMKDIKRHSQWVKDACEALTPMVIDNVLKFATPNLKGCTVFNPMHTPEFLSPRDFEKVYWPSYKKIMEELTSAGYHVTSYYEKNYSHLYDYLQDLPENMVAGLFEEDDLKAAKKALPNMCIIGGMDCFTLNYGTKEQCIDMAKELLDQVAPGGRYVFTTNKIMHSENDANPDNLRAVNEFVMANGSY